MGKQRRTQFMLGALAVALLAGCSQAGNEGSGAETSQELIDMAIADAETYAVAPTDFEPFDPGPAPAPQAGLIFGSVTCLWSVPACKRIAEGVRAAGEDIGWSTTVIDGTPDPNNQRQALDQFVSSGTAAVVLAAVEPRGLEDILDRMKDADIPWVGINMLNPTDFGAIGNLDVVGGLEQAGRQLGAWVAADSEGQAKVLMMSSTDNPALQLRDQGFEEYLSQFPGIELVGETTYVPFSQVGPPLQSQVESTLQGIPEGGVDYIYTPFDGFATYVSNGVEAAGRSEIKVLGFDASPQNLDIIRSGGAQAATVATAWEWCGYAAVDALNRALNGEEFVDKGCPSQVIDRTNLPPEGELFVGGSVDFRFEFMTRWGTR
jgi:ribose transport system substrate-binding protein